MYKAPRVKDFGSIDIHTYALPGSSPEVEETAVTGGGGIGGASIGLVGLLGAGAAVLGRSGSDEATASIQDEEEKKTELK